VAKLEALPPLKVDLPPAPELPVLPGEGPCTGLIRPGAPLIINRAFLCTMNWVFADDAGALYVGTAGHCLPPGWNQLETFGLAGDFGDQAFDINDGLGHDFGLIRIDPAFDAHVDPTLCHWGGPSHQANLLSVEAFPAMRRESPALHYGWGYQWGGSADTRPRAGSLIPTDIDDTWELIAAEVTPGDSGSPLMSFDGGAALIITHSILAPSPAPPLGSGVGAGTRIDQAIALADAGAGLRLHLVTSPHAVDLTGMSTP
jgi:hypothetical protein